MADGSKIEWLRGPDGRPGATWNPIVGCSIVSPGCINCYAMRLAMNRDFIAALSETDCAYIAGLIDGEGSIYVLRHTGRGSRQTYYPAISIAMTHYGVLAWYAGKLGLAVSDVPRTPERWRDQHSVRIHGKRALALCRRLLPYLKVKREQAELLLTFPFEDRHGRSPAGRFLDPEIVARRAQLRERVNALNARGKP